MLYKKYHSELMRIKIGPDIADDLMRNIRNTENFNQNGLDKDLYSSILKSFQNNYIYIEITEDNYPSWYHIEDYTRHVKPELRQKFILPFYRQITNEVMHYHLAISCQFRMSQPLWHKYASNKAKPIYYYPFWEKPGKYHDYNPGPYDKGTYYFTNRLRSYLQKQPEFNKTNQILKINNELYSYNQILVDKRLYLYKKNIEFLKLGSIVKKCTKI